MASIYEHPKSGNYHVAFWFEGRQYRKTLQTKNQRKAEEDAKAVQRAVDALADGRDKEGVNLLRRGISAIDVIFPTPAIKTLLDETATKPMLLGELRDRWLDYQRTQGRKKSYIDCEKFRLGPFVRVLGADFRVDHLTTDDPARVIDARRKDGSMKYTIREGLGVLRNVIDRAVRLERLTENPVKVWPKLKIEARKEFLPKHRVEEIIASSNLPTFPPHRRRPTMSPTSRAPLRSPSRSTSCSRKT